MFNVKMDRMTQTLTCRVQYLNDIDPFRASTNFPEPPRPPLHSFNVNIPLVNQIAGVHRLLQAPHRLDDCSLQLYKHQGNDNAIESDCYGPYLDPELTISEQSEDFEGFRDNRKNAIILRTRLSVRVHSIIERLLNSSGGSLRRALFTLKQIFQDDKDLVHAFVQNDGLACLIKVGSENDQNYQNYILRALGQVMLYVDGMNGVIEHNETIQWLYSLISSQYRLVVKTALKLLLVFVEYQDSNCLLLLEAVNIVDSERGAKPWHNIINLLNEKNWADMELLIFAMTLVNQTLAGISDQDTYYDVVDSLEEQGMERVIQYYMSRQGIDMDLLRQFQIYEAVLRHEDGEDEGEVLPLDARHLIPRSRSRGYLGTSEEERRKSRRHSTGNLPPKASSKITSEIVPSWQRKVIETTEQFNRKAGRPKESTHLVNGSTTNGSSINGSPASPGSTTSTTTTMTTNSAGTTTIEKQSNGSTVTTTTLISDDITPGLRRRRERDAHNSTMIKQQSDYNLRGQRASICSCSSADSYGSTSSSGASSAYSLGSNEEKSPLIETIKLVPPLLVEPKPRPVSLGGSLGGATIEDELNKRNKEFSQWNDQSDSSYQNGGSNLRVSGLSTTSNEKKSWMLSMMYGKNSEIDDDLTVTTALNNNKNSANNIVNNNTINGNNNNIVNNNNNNLVKPPTSPKLWSPISNSNGFPSTVETISGSSIGVKTIQERILKSPSPAGPRQPNKVSGIKESTGPGNPVQDHLHWDNLTNALLSRPLYINDLDFTDLKSDDDQDIFQPHFDTIDFFQNNEGSSPIPPPPPPPTDPGCGVPPPPPPPFMTMNHLNGNSLRPFPNSGPPPPPFNPSFLRQNGLNGILVNGREQNTPSPTPDANSKSNNNKNKKTVKLFWKEVKEDKSLLSRLKKKKTIWDDIKTIPIDTQKLEHLFENRSKELANKEKAQEGKKNELIVLDAKRSNAINIGMTKLPPPRTIKTAIMKMDSTIMNRDGIEKILTMMPTEDEKTKITEAQMANPDIPLGSAENFLLTLASISDLEARLKLWAFKLDYDAMEKEIAEQLMDLKRAIEEIEKNDTFRIILATLLSVGNFLNGNEVKGFQIEYLCKVPEVKDTVHKHSLLHHLCHIVMEKFPTSSDLYSEFGSVTRAYKIDFDDVHRTIQKLESDCKASWDYLKVIAKHEDKTPMRTKMSEFLLDCAERITVLKIVHRRVLNRFKKLLIFLGFSSSAAKETKPHQVLQIISEFALEYRTTRERVKEQIEKKASHRERNKTRGKMITETDNFKSKEQTADQKLRKVLDNGYTDVEADPKVASKWGTLPGARTRQRSNSTYENHCNTLNGKSNGTLTDADDEILESLVKTVTAQPLRADQRAKRKSRFAERKSFRRTRNVFDLSEEERLMLENITS
ncbi:FH1/FH2 domain-containing protein 3 isoform X1 [Tetranychus urticae]|uniref:FH1/FH2 domain-containing protein 3 isoform X1 n=1 Tax=Tetranychus urticae TaxID=32264 RepID=UPI00077BF338|nr:FH1/FH2 domain-containing protein 3 isoform X1 [Tetranychus urticae]